MSAPAGRLASGGPDTEAPRPNGRETGVASLVHPPRRARLIFSAVLAAAGFGVAWLIGMDYWHGAAIAVLVLAAGVAWISVPEHADVSLTEEPYEQREGVRREVIDLSWALRRQRGGIRDTAFRRVRALAAALLAERGLDLDDPADGAHIQRAIGAYAYSVLARRPGRFASLASVRRCLDALDALIREKQ
jgi:hypothetical protein